MDLALLVLRVVVGLHSTWLINSATHLWGRRRFATTDDSRNSWWVAMLTFGEGWHNNHHAYQRMAKHGHRWWELDVSYLSIRALELIGLASQVVKPRHRTVENVPELPAAADCPLFTP